MKRSNGHFIRKAERHEVSGVFFSMPLLIIHKKSGLKQIIASGQRDDISVFQDKESFYVLSTNKMLGCAGLEIIDFDNLTNEFTENPNIFFQNVNGLECKKDFFDYADYNQLKILLQYLQ